MLWGLNGAERLPCFLIFFDFLPFFLFFSLSFCLFNFFSFCLVVVLSFCYFVILSFCRVVFLSCCHVVILSFLSFCLFVFLSVCLFVCMSFCLDLCWSNVWKVSNRKSHSLCQNSKVAAAKNNSWRSFGHIITTIFSSPSLPCPNESQSALALHRWAQFV